MARQFITRERPLRRILLQALLWSAIISAVLLYFLLTQSSVGGQLQQWFASITATATTSNNNEHSNSNDFSSPNSQNSSSSSSRQQLRPDNRLSAEQMAPQVLRPITVRTGSGRLRGFVQQVAGHQEVATFLSVPYGQPPVGPLRFRPTVPVESWAPETRDASRLPPPCIQSEYTQRLFPVHILNENVTEACLYLNIWAPLGKGEHENTNRSKGKDEENEEDADKLRNGQQDKKKKAVMVLIHGGLFTIGSTGIDEYDGRMLAAAGDVVVVTVQYRLGIFGFLDLDTEQVPGNMGLLDQVTAFQWVADNAAAFGGDPGLITLFGTSAGSISIGFHMFSPRAGPLFRRAILQSGSPMLMKQVYSRGEALAERFASMVGCFDKGGKNGSAINSIYDDPEPVVSCLDQVPFETIYRVQGELVANNPVPFMPTIPSEYIDQFINDYNESTVLHQKEVLMGFNTNEGSLMLHAAYPKVYTRTSVPPYTTIKEVQKRVVEMGTDSGLTETQASTIATLLIKGKERDTPTRWAQTVADLFSDIMFVCPTYEFANKLETYNVTRYLYLFSQRAKNVEWGEWMSVTHHDEVGFIMGYPLRYPHLYSQEDVDISSKMITTWTTFAKTGKIPASEFSERWTPYSQSTKYYMQIKAGATRLGSNFHNESCDLYNLLAEYVN